MHLKIKEDLYQYLNYLKKSIDFLISSCNNLSSSRNSTSLLKAIFKFSIKFEDFFL